MTESRSLSWFCRQRREREKKEQICEINKILGCKAIVTVYICMVTIAKMKMYNDLEGLMWGVFEEKCVKLTTFCIMQGLA